jgi:hypothetical protein
MVILLIIVFFSVWCVEVRGFSTGWLLTVGSFSWNGAQTDNSETFTLTIQIHTDSTERGRKREGRGVINHATTLPCRFPCAFNGNYHPFFLHTVKYICTAYDLYSEDDRFESRPPSRRFSLFYLVPPREFRDCIVTYATTASFHIHSNSSFTLIRPFYAILPELLRA